MTIRQANDRARDLFGPNVLCETHRTGQTYERVIVLGGLPGTPVGKTTIRFPASIPWGHAFDVVSGLLGQGNQEGT
jgi:hypothetical protein